MGNSNIYSSEFENVKEEEIDEPNDTIKENHKKITVKINKDEEHIRRMSRLYNPEQMTITVYEQDIVKIKLLQNAVRRYIIRKQLKDINKIIENNPHFQDIKLRRNIIKEIISTEKTYIDNLKSLIDVYLDPLKEMAKNGTPLISENEIECIFGNISIIYNFHCILYEDLTKEWKELGLYMDIPSLFLNRFHFLKMYIPYINNFGKSLQTLTNCQQNQKFSVWFNNKNNEKNMSALLILCVQRIPRYVLLLKELNKQLPENHVQKKNMTELVNVTTEIADFINSAKREADNAQRLYEIEMYFNSNENLRLMEHHRKFQKEGFFEISTENIKKPFYVHVFLFNDSILLAVRNDNFNHFTSVAFILFAFSNLKDEVDDNYPFCFSITEKLFSINEKYLFICKDENEKSLWLDMLTKNYSDTTNKKKNFLNKLKNENLENSVLISFHMKTQSINMSKQFEKSGWMLKKGNFVKNWKKRWFVLSNDDLSYYSKPSDSSPIKTISMVCVDFIFEVDPSLQEELKTMDVPSSRLIQIRDKSSKRNYYLIPENQKEFEDWNLHLLFANNKWDEI